MIAPTATDYEAARAWARAAHHEWEQHRVLLPKVRHRTDEYERGTVGHLGFDRWNRENLSLDYIKSNKRPGHMRITADDIAKGHVQVKVGARYVDIREVIREGTA